MATPSSPQSSTTRHCLDAIARAIGNEPVRRLASLINWSNESSFQRPPLQPWGYFDSASIPNEILESASTAASTSAELIESSSSSTTSVSVVPASEAPEPMASDPVTAGSEASAPVDSALVAERPIAAPTASEPLQVTVAIDAALESPIDTGETKNTIVQPVSTIGKAHDNESQPAIHAVSVRDDTVSVPDLTAPAPQAIAPAPQAIVTTPASTAPIREAAAPAPQVAVPAPQAIAPALQATAPDSEVTFKPPIQATRPASVQASAAQHLVDNRPRPTMAASRSQPAPLSVPVTPAVSAPARPATSESTDAYLQQLERLVLELNYELGKALCPAPVEEQHDATWMMHRLIELNLQNMALRDQLRQANAAP